MLQLDQVMSGLYRISTFVESMGLSFNQYLIKDEKSILIHTGSATMYGEIAEKLWQVAAPADLAYIFISHFESDECGALLNFLDLNSNIVPVVSAWTARQLTGFGLHPQPLAVKEGDELVLGRRRLRFIAYPSEAHLREGLLAYELEDRMLFSSDLFMVRGKEAAPLIKGERSIIRNITPQSVPVEEARRKCQETLDQLSIAIVAPGHGPVLDLRT